MTPQIDILLPTDQSGDAVGIIELTVPAGWDGPPLHHHGFDEAFYVLEGELTFQLGEAVRAAGPGELVFAPRGATHTLANLAGRDSLAVFSRMSRETHWLCEVPAALAASFILISVCSSR